MQNSTNALVIFFLKGRIEEVGDKEPVSREVVFIRAGEGGELFGFYRLICFQKKEKKMIKNEL